MTGYRYILALALALMMMSGLSVEVKAQDDARMSSRTIMGTARYVGMGGAMSAIGADPSAVLDNVAGLGLYRRPEVMLTFDYTVKSIFTAPQASIVLSFKSDRVSVNGIQYHNLMLGYHRVHSFNAYMKPTSGEGPSLGALIASTGADIGMQYPHDKNHIADSLVLSERGYANEYTIDYALNVSNRFYWGIGLRIQSYQMASDGDYYEWFSKTNTYNEYYRNRSRTSFVLTGVGCSMATGFIYRPTSWLRMGFGLETPSMGHLNVSTSGSFYALMEEDSISDAPRGSDSWTYHMPLRLSTSVAFQISQYAMIALQYDYRRVIDAYDIHMLKAGVEVVPYPGVYMNAGYAYESPFKKINKVVEIDKKLDRQDAYFMNPRSQHYISGAIGYRGTYMMIQAAYQYRLERFNLYAHQNADPYPMRGDRHRIVLTLGWHGR